MTPSWIIEKDVFNDGTPEKMADIAESKGMAVKIVGYIPFDGGLMDAKTRHVHQYDAELFAKEDCVVAYGSINLVRRLLRERPWIPTAWMDLSNLTCQAYYSHWGQWLLNERYAMVPWGDLPRVIWSLYDSLSRDDCLFIRPNDNTKAFSGSVVSRDEFLTWREREDSCYQPSPESMVVVATPREIEAEWRVVIGQGEVITASMYREAGALKMQVGAPDEALALAGIIAKHSWQPGAMYVVDVCLCPDGYKLLEIGSVNCAGLYSCDLEKVVDAMSGLAKKEWEDVNNG